MRKTFFILLVFIIPIIIGCSDDNDVKTTDVLKNTVWLGEHQGEVVTLAFFKDNDFNIQSKGGEEDINVNGVYILTGKSVLLKPHEKELETISGILNSDNSKLTITGADNQKVTLIRK